MARKDLLKGLMPDPSDSQPPPAPSGIDPGRPRYTKGAIGAVSRSIADLKSRSLIEIDAALIDAGGMQDRLESDSADDAALMQSIAEYGQQVPVLVRPHPQIEGRYQIVYGRRRVLAMRDLGQPVKALIRDLDDRELVLAQGQENTARRDLSFIEKTNFARQMSDAGYDRKIICDALSIDKTLISRMFNVADQVPFAVIEGIGSAPSVGRDRWLSLATLAEDAALMDREDEDLQAMLSVAILDAGADTSDARFDALFAYLDGSAKKRAAEVAAQDTRAPELLTSQDGLRLGDVTRAKATVTLRLRRRNSRGFEDWLVDNLAEIHRSWQDQRGG